MTGSAPTAGPSRPRPAVDPRIEARRREVLEVRRTRRRRQWLAFTIAATVVALVYFATRSALLDVDEVTVHGAVRSSTDELRERSGVRVGQPLTEVDSDATRSRLRTSPWVLDATVDRSWSGSVSLSVTERTPVAALAVDGGRWLLVDGERRVLAEVSAPPAELTVVEGERPAAPGEVAGSEVQPVLHLAAELTPGVRSRVQAIRRRGDGELELALRPVGVVRFGAADGISAKLTAIRTVLGQVDLECLSLLDVRVPDAPVLTRQEPCA